ncbi:MAG: flagellar hook assembly protein FlgD [Desulfobulbus sp.]|jgi:flagellar basal-body rod modification protein FlgD|uniref:flagellar hook assembly protein FlgD n=1 Tax=Desulfobulbus sp. TaxID=895 RepID=UPI00284DCEAC|nr:flagellar hook capping FlgD N-terminal domain-containing protein [Desulfobulbus sp.]MDR2550765.1 flagellar hook assembly protein FlgD [Desulfobulbus sp.]
MSTVNQTNSVTTAAAATTTSKSKAGALGQEQFLSLLVAQLQHQDPLNPSDPTEFTAQLAQYSQLEQLFNLNDSMDQLAAATSSSERYAALGLIGQEVVVENNEFALGDKPVQVGYRIDGNVTGASLEIKNKTGQTVATIKATDLSAGNHFLTWDGKDSEGNAMAPGNYSISISATGAGGTSATVSPLVRAQVTGIDLSGAQAKIVTALGEYKISSLYGAYSGQNQNTTDSSSS